MSSLRRVLNRMTALFRGDDRAIDDDVRAEMEAHLAMEIDENIRRGLEPAEARRRALLASGGLTQAAERVREQRSLPWLESIVADMRYAVRQFRRTPLSTATIVTVLSLGIGTVVVLLTMFNSIATMPAPGIERDESLARIRGTMGSAEARMLSWPEVQAYAGRADLFSSVAAYADESASIETGEQTSSAVSVIFTTSNYFSMLGVQPVLGTAPAAEPDVMRMTSSPTAMISHAMWQQRFGGARDVIGRVVRVNETPVEIVGVAPPRFRGTEYSRAMTIWMPLAAYPLIQQRTAAAFLSADSAFLSAIAQLRPGVTPATAAPLVAGIATQVAEDASGTARTVGGEDVARSEMPRADVVPLLASNSRISARSDLMLSAATAGVFALLVLLITCTNVSALLVGLAAGRRREIGVRLSLGAPRGRVIRQLLTESVLLALAAAAAGLLITTVGIRLVGTMFDDTQFVVDWRVTLATCAVALVTGLLFGLSPALHATRVSVGEVLKSTTLSVAATRSRLQRALVVAQITLTQPLLVGLGVLVVSAIADVRGGADVRVAEHIAEVALDTWAGRVDVDEREARIAAVVERVGELPGVTIAMPMQMGFIRGPLTVHPADRLPGVSYGVMKTRLIAAPAGYFSAYEIPVVRGRDFDARDRADMDHNPMDGVAYETAIIGSDLARRLWRDADPIGRRLSLGANGSPMMVVGIVDEAVAGPSEVNGEIRVYVPYAEASTGVIARTAGPALPMLDAVRRVVAAEAPQMPVYRAETLAQREAEFRRRMLRASSAVAGGGLLALLLSAIGLYAVVAFAVGQRTREIGIRTALGAQSGQVIRLFFMQGLRLSALGLVLGLPLSMLAIRAIVTTLGWPLSNSPVVGGAIAALVLVVASIAVWIPARRASTVDPMEALRLE